jgi:hypothetical protein
MNRYPEAATLLRSLAASTTRPEVRESATNVLRQIQDLQRLRASSDARRPAAGRPPAPAFDTSPGSTLPDRSEPRFVPSWRPVGPGEERVEGELERIECDAAKSVALVLKVPEGTARFGAAALDQIEFITYRDDLRGSIGCGPLLGGPMKVYVTHATDADRKTSRVVAVEFLPREK